MEGFTEESLSRLSFKDSIDGIAHLKGLAKRSGFKLCLRDRASAQCVRFECSMSSRCQGKTKSHKTGCPFHFSLICGDGETPWRVGHSKKLEHQGHILQPRPNAIPLTEEVMNVVRRMKSVGIHQIPICEFIRGQYGFEILPVDVEAVSAHLDADATLQDTERLEAEARERNEMIEFFTIESEFSSVRVGCFTQTDDERANLSLYGDVIFLDGTAIDNSLRWDTFPITLLDRNRQIRSGGVFFLGLQTTEVFVWLLSTIHQIIGDRWETLITDEDSAMMIAVPEFRQAGHQIRHYICIFHKYANIRRHINQLSCPKDTKLLLIRLAQKICYGQSEAEVDQALNQMIEIAPDLQNYVDTNVRSLIPLFADCCKGDALTLGYRGTSVAESANAMIRRHLPGTVLRLADLRRAVTSAYTYRWQGNPGRLLLSREMRTILASTGLGLEQNIIEILEKSIAKSRRMMVEACENGDFVVVDGEKRYIVEPSRCQCRYPRCWGLPCPHLIVAYRHFDHPFPAAMVHPRWLLTPPGEPFTFPAFTIRLGAITDSSSDEHQPQESPSSSSSSDEDDNIPIDAMAVMPDDDDFSVQTDPQERMPNSDRERFMTLFQNGKEIARLGQSTTVYPWVNDQLRMIVQRLIDSGEPAPPAPPPTDQRSQRKRGRPRRTGHSDQSRETAAAIRAKCSLCGSLSHSLADCRHRAVLDEIIREYPGQQDGRRRCKICRYSGHNQATCPCLRDARERIHEDQE
jgi:hypothetical protein